jgi:pimeloyl-ACP methyl ester carboxylesterase
MYIKGNLSRCRVRAVLVTAVLILIAAALPASAAVADASHHPSHQPKPTIVLVHGAWADSSSWSGVVQRLQHDGYTVDVPPNPLRGLASDAAYIAAFLHSVTGPIVLVGHSYGGAVITNAATGNPNVKSLVFVDAFVPDLGESVVQLAGAQPGSALAVQDPTTVFTFATYPGSPPGDFDAYILPSVFPSAFAADLPAKTATVLASTQRPVTLSALGTPSGAPAWKTIPSWYLAGADDQVLPVAEQLIMAERAHSRIVTVHAFAPVDDFTAEGRRAPDRGRGAHDQLAHLIRPNR